MKTTSSNFDGKSFAGMSRNIDFWNHKRMLKIVIFMMQLLQWQKHFKYVTHLVFSGLGKGYHLAVGFLLI